MKKRRGQEEKKKEEEKHQHEIWKTSLGRIEATLHAELSRWVRASPVRWETLLIHNNVTYRASQVYTYVYKTSERDDGRRRENDDAEERRDGGAFCEHARAFVRCVFVRCRVYSILHTMGHRTAGSELPVSHVRDAASQRIATTMQQLFIFFPLLIFSSFYGYWLHDTFLKRNSRVFRLKNLFVPHEIYVEQINLIWCEYIFQTADSGILFFFNVLFKLYFLFCSKLLFRLPKAMWNVYHGSYVCKRESCIFRINDMLMLLTFSVKAKGCDNPMLLRFYPKCQIFFHAVNSRNVTILSDCLCHVENV